MSTLHLIQIPSAFPWAYADKAISAPIMTYSGCQLCCELPKSPSGNRWILTAVCPHSNYLRAIQVPDKTATTVAKALFNDVFLLLGFPSVFQSDHGGEFLNALLHWLTKLLSIKQVFISGFRSHLNGATEQTHHFLNSASGIYCEHHQEQWEDYLQPAVCAHNVAPHFGHIKYHPIFFSFWT